MKRLKKISMFLVSCVLTVFCANTSVFASESKVNLFSGNNSVGPWNMATSLKNMKYGGTFNSSAFKDKGYFYVEYTGEKEGMQLILQSWSGGEGWALANPSEVGTTDENVNYAKFDEDSIKAVYKADLSTLDAIHVWNIRGPITLKSIDYVIEDSDKDNNKDEDNKGDDTKDDEIKDDNKEFKVVAPTEDNIRYLGRAYNYKNELWLAPSASGAEFDFTGKELSITFKGDNFAYGENNNNARVAVLVNNKVVVDKMITQAESTVKVFESKETETVRVKIVKLSEAPNGTLGIKDIKTDKDGVVKKTEKKARSIEFIGDSITCGYGVDDENRDHSFKTATEDVMKTYAYKTATNLDADINVTAYSGYGIVSGYSGSGVKNSTELVPKYYNKVAFSYGAFNSELKPDELLWDFDRYQPDLVVINLGTNDTNYCNNDERKAEFVQGYVDFIKQIRENNPNAKILCTLGIMGDSLYDYVEAAVNNYKDETGDLDVYSMKFDVQNYEDGYAADWHPTEKTHTKAAKKLINEVKEIMNW